MIKRWSLLLLACLSLACPRQPEPVPPSPTVTVTPSVAAQPMAEWTLIFYFAADNDLEAAELADLEELTQIDVDPKQVRILALVDRSPLGEPGEGYTHRAVANMPNWSHARLLEVHKDKLVELENWGRVSMADPQTLRRLLVLAQEKYPSRRRALFMVDHGQAWAGICADESASDPDDTLTPKELSDVLSALPQPLELLVFDACMMSSLEVYLACAPYARYLVASQDSLPGQGLDYREALSKLSQDDGLHLGRRILSSYRNSLRQDPREMSRLQLSLLDGQPHIQVATEWADFAKQLNASVGKQWLNMARARARAQSFRIESGPRSGAEMRDLGQLLGQFRSITGLKMPTELLKAVVVEQATGDFRKRCSGISIFFPPQAEYLRENSHLDYPAQLTTLLPTWVDFLKNYTQLEPRYKGKHPPLSEVKFVSEKHKGHRRIDISAQLGQPGSLVQGYTILAQGNRVLGQLTCAVPEGANRLHDFFDGSWLFLREKTGRAGLPVQLQTVEYEGPNSNRALATMSCQFRRKGSKSWIDAQLYFSLEPEQPNRPGRFLGARRSSGIGWTDLRLQPQDELAFASANLTPGGVARRGPSLRLVRPNELQVVSQKVAPGQYSLGFMILDLQGRRTWRTRPLKW